MKSGRNRRIKKGLLISTGILSICAVAVVLYYLELIRYPTGIVQPFAHEINYSIAKFNPSEEFVFEQPTGTKIIIPANSLVDSTGKLVNGEVELRFREFHDVEAIFLSGIPMQFGADREQFFASAGMFEVRAFKGEQELALKSGASLKVDLANFLDTMQGNFELFELEDNLSWGEGNAFDVVTNATRDSLMNELSKLPPAPKNPIPDSSEFIFELVADENKMPHLKAWKGVKWELLDCTGDLTADQAMRVDWDRIKITKEKKRNYIIEVGTDLVRQNGDLVSYSTSLEARPLLKGQALKEAIAQFEDDEKKYAVTLAKIGEETKRVKQQAAMLNRFTVDGFGIYNCDRIDETLIFATISIEFDFEDEINPLINEVMLFMLLEDENGVLSYKSHEWNKLPYLSSRVTLVAVLPDGNVAVVSADEFQSLLDNNSGKRHFKLNTVRIPYELFKKEYTPKSSSSPKFV